jgi:hypothetical protein
MALTWQACSHLAVRRMRPRIARGGLQVRCCLGTRYDRGEHAGTRCHLHIHESVQEWICRGSRPGACRALIIKLPLMWHAQGVMQSVDLLVHGPLA